MSYSAQQNDYFVNDQSSNYQFDMSQCYIHITIAFVYVFFLALLVDRILDYDSVEKICNFTGITEQVYLDKRKMCDKSRKDYEERKFTYMIMIGVISIFGGALLTKIDKTYTTGGWSVSTGGMMLVIYYTIMNWNSLDKNLQVIVLGTTFAVLFYGSTMFY
jgi:hypothetical protein